MEEQVPHVIALRRSLCLTVVSHKIAIRVKRVLPRAAVLLLRVQLIITLLKGYPIYGGVLAHHG